MTRKKVKLAFIASEAARKASLKKRRVGLMKKVSELSTLCAVRAAAVVYSPDSNEPVYWPSTRLEVDQILARYMSIPEMERSRKMVNQESYLKERNAKLVEQHKKLVRKNKDLENLHLMQQLYIYNKSTNEFATSEIHSLMQYVEEKSKDIQRRMDFLKQNDDDAQQPPPPDGPPSTATEGPTAMEEITQQAGDGSGSRGDGPLSFDRWFWDMMRTSGNLAGSSGSNKQDDPPHPPSYSAGGSGSTASHAGATDLPQANLETGSDNWGQGAGSVHREEGGSLGYDIMPSQGHESHNIRDGSGREIRALFPYGQGGGGDGNFAPTPPTYGYAGNMSSGGSGMTLAPGDTGGSGSYASMYRVRPRLSLDPWNTGGEIGGGFSTELSQGDMYGGMSRGGRSPVLSHAHGAVGYGTMGTYGENVGGFPRGNDETVASYGFGATAPLMVAPLPVAQPLLGNLGSNNSGGDYISMYQGNFGTANVNRNDMMAPPQGGNGDGGGFGVVVPPGNFTDNRRADNPWMQQDTTGGNTGGSRGGNNSAGSNYNPGDDRSGYYRT